VLAAEHLPGLAGVDFRAELVEPFRQIGRDLFARLRPFDEDGKVVGAPLQRGAQRAVGLERLPPLEDLLRRRLVFPEVGLGDLLFYLGELVGRLGGVKDSSADRTRAW
jgi:hypothetical protein